MGAAIALASFEYEMTLTLGALQGALAREMAAMVLLREADNDADRERLRRELMTAATASMGAFEAWERLTMASVRP